jgi:hypothetical protein
METCLRARCALDQPCGAVPRVSGHRGGVPGDNGCVPRLCTEGYTCPAHRACGSHGGDKHGCVGLPCWTDDDCPCGPCVAATATREGICAGRLGICADANGSGGSGGHNGSSEALSGRNYVGYGGYGGNGSCGGYGGNVGGRDGGVSSSTATTGS